MAYMGTTCLCGFAFATTEALHAHAKKSEHLFKCHCGTIAGSKKALKNHKRDVQHTDKGVDTYLDFTDAHTADNECGLCVHRKPFCDRFSRDRHVADKHNACPSCAQVFQSMGYRLRHQKEADHCYCAEHNLAFGGVAELELHKRDDAHISSYECTDCDRSFRSDKALEDHLDSIGHRRVIAEAAIKNLEKESAATKLAEIEEANLHCAACKRTFVNLNAFRQHKSSLKHKPLSEIKCPLSKECTGTFTSPSALLFHLESGGCKSGMTRHKLNAIVYQHDNDRYITSTTHASKVINTAVSEVSHASIAPNSSASNRARSVSLESHAAAVGDDIGNINDRYDVPSTVGSYGSGTVNDIDIRNLLGSEVEVVDTPSASETASTLSSGGVILTPSASATSSSHGNYTPSASVLSDGSIILTPPASISTSNALSDWSFLNSSRAMTPSASSIDGSSVDTITFDTASQRWPCQICSATFRKKNDLVQHMDSVVHAPKIFHCPTDLPGLHGSAKHTVYFKTLSGLAQHVEAGSCKGGKSSLGFIVGLFEKQTQAKLEKSVKLLKE